MNRLFVLQMLLVPLFIIGIVVAQPLTPLGVQIDPVTFGAITLADFDADGDMDLITSGNESLRPELLTSFYRNDGMSTGGNLTFTPFTSDFNTLKNPSLDTGDYDNDGDIDLLMANTQSVVVYKNDGSGSFLAIPVFSTTVTDPDAGLIPVINSPIAVWADFDMDGDLDIAFAHAARTSIFKYEGLDRFVEVGVQFPKISNGTLAVGDYDGDSDSDILIMSMPLSGEAFIRIYRNNLKNGFELVSTPLPAIRIGSVNWGDYDRDGDLDLLIMGNTALQGVTSTAVNAIYRNDSGTFNRISTVLPVAAFADWIDLNSDGMLDILINGSLNNETYTSIYQQDQNGFNSIVDKLPGVWFGDVTSTDLDSDGDLDIIMTGRVTTSQGRVPQVIWLRNDAPALQVIVSTPKPGIMPYMYGNSCLVMQWNAAEVENGTRDGVTYNVRVGTKPGGFDVLSPASLSTGKRLVTKAGNAGTRLSLTLSGLNPKNSYYWSVQAVDPSGRGTGFSKELRVDGFLSRTGGGKIGPPALLDNFPNPFNPITTINFALASPGQVKVAVYNVLGAEIAVLADGYYEAGIHRAVWNSTDMTGSEVPSGVYLYRLMTPEQSVTRTMVLLR